MGSIIAKLMDWIEQVFKWIFSDWKNLIIFALLVAGIVLFFKYRSAEKRMYDYQNQITDSLTTYKNKIGELYLERSTHITTIKDLKKSNSELYNEVKNLKANPVVVTQVQTVTQVKEITINDTAYIEKPGIYSYPLKYSDQWCAINGKSSIDTNTMKGTTNIDSISIPSDITIDLIERNKNLSFIAKSNNPYVKINSVNGAVISPENSSAIKKRFDKKWVVSAGVGPSVTIIDNKVKVVPGMHVTVGRKLFGF